MAKKPISKTPKRKPATKQVVRGGKAIKRRGLKSPVGLVVVVLVAALGLYTLLQSDALSNDKRLIDNPARGQLFHGLREATSGPCKGSIEIDERGPDNSVVCTHADPGPEGVDVREREKHILADLQAQVEYDNAHPAKNASEEPPAPMLTGGFDSGAPGSLGVISPRNWPCTGTGSDGYRVQMIYAYPSGYANRGSTLRPSFESIARRVNAVMYNSAVASGGRRQVSFMTSTSCALTITPAAVSGDITSFTNVISRLRALGFTSVARKYLIMVDYGTLGAQCGWGQMQFDTRPSTVDNINNKGNMFAMVWRPCWNYAEPHELMHMLGAVQNGAPYSTGKTHCTDQHDVLCYKDTSGITPTIRCSSTTFIWRYDCGNDTYFHASTPGGWLSTHWNTANSYWLYRGL